MPPSFAYELPDTRKQSGDPPQLERHPVAARAQMSGIRQTDWQ
jgi:hypothetical protein